MKDSNKESTAFAVALKQIPNSVTYLGVDHEYLPAFTGDTQEVPLGDGSDRLGEALSTFCQRENIRSIGFEGAFALSIFGSEASVWSSNLVGYSVRTHHADLGFCVQATRLVARAAKQVSPELRISLHFLNWLLLTYRDGKVRISQVSPYRPIPQQTWLKEVFKRAWRENGPPLGSQ